MRCGIPIEIIDEMWYSKRDYKWNRTNVKWRA